MKERIAELSGEVYVNGIFQIRRLEVDNFKGFKDFTIDLSPFTVVIGDNAVGKSSLLQVIAFLKYACTASVEEYMKDRGVTVDDIATKGLPKISRIMSFEIEFTYSDISVITWSISFLLDKANNRITLRTENVTETRGEKQIVWLDYNQKKGFRLRKDTSERELITSGMYPSSLLKFVDERSGGAEYPVLVEIKNFFSESELLDLLAPQHMRKTVRGKERTLGVSGEKLPSLIQQIHPVEKKKLLQNIQAALPNMSEIRSVAGRAGWTHLETEECYRDRRINIQASGISDGTLRLMAFFSLEFLKKHGGITLLDEVEDGINVANIQNCLDYLRYYCDTNQQQILLTTHSTVVLDYVEPEEIRYLYQNDEGFVKCIDFEALKDVKEKLKFLYPGEIILNSSREDLIVPLVEE
ncbi:AAA family ATPase [Anaerovibrio sp.]|uniref:AAA family ATPase n=1 Tax=Anaerovibrio sp. TaxID=1872532 RepID=UPI0025C6FD2F|nr:AAA family ATPase [Anaerovibrio sp.]